jgi:hypothetical protein
MLLMGLLLVLSAMWAARMDIGFAILPSTDMQVADVKKENNKI